MEFRDLPFELWKVALYENNTISLEKVKTENDFEDDINTLGNDSLMHSLKSYSEDEAFKNSTVDLKPVYEDLKEDSLKNMLSAILQLPRLILDSILMERES